MISVLVEVHPVFHSLLPHLKGFIECHDPDRELRKFDANYFATTPPSTSPGLPLTISNLLLRVEKIN